MTAETFDALLTRRLELTRQVLGVKAGEYATGGDRLHNFKRAAELSGCHPAKALVGMWMKHVVSVLDIVDRLSTSGVLVSRDRIDEKLGDAVNYLVLLEACLLETDGE